MSGGTDRWDSHAHRAPAPPRPPAPPAARRATRPAPWAREERLRALVQNTAALVTTFDAEGWLTYASPSLTKLTGYVPEDAVGTHLTGLTHPDDLPAVQQAWDLVIASPGEVIETVGRIVRTDGEIRWLAARAQNHLDDPHV